MPYRSRPFHALWALASLDMYNANYSIARLASVSMRSRAWSCKRNALHRAYNYISEVLADWHELIIPHRRALSSIKSLALANNWIRGAARRHSTAPVSHTRLTHGYLYLLIFCFVEGIRYRPTELAWTHSNWLYCLHLIRVSIIFKWALINLE